MLPWIAGAWLAGLFVGAQWQPTAGPLLVAVGLLCALIVALHGEDLRARLWSVPLSFCALLCGLGTSPSAALPCKVRGNARIVAHVEGVRHGVDDARIVLRVIEGHVIASRQRLPEGLQATAKIGGATTPPVGSIVSVTTELRPRTQLRNPSPHPRLYSSSSGGCWARWDAHTTLDVVHAPSWTAGLDRARAAVRAHMNHTLPSEVAGVTRALVLGDGGALGYEQRRTIAAVGLAHLFAVSGLHVALVSGTLVRALQWLLQGATIGFASQRFAAALGVPLTLLHALFAGGSPSAWRAAITAAIAWSVVAAGRRPSSTAITGAAALILSAPDPSMATRPAFLLSIVATSAILSAPRGRRGRLRSAATISARTLVATTPMVWWWFGGVPLIGWLTNIVVLPFGSWVVIPLAHAFALTASIPIAVDPMAAALDAAVRVLLACCEAFAPLAVTRRLPPLDPVQGVIVLSACVLLLVARSWRMRAAVLLLAAVGWLAADRALVAREQPRGELRVTFVDVGQGDAALVDFPDGRAALIDTGPGDRHPAMRELRTLLAARRRSRIDLVIITHGHPDHFGGLEALMEDIDVGEIWLNGQLLVEERDGRMTRLVSSALRRGTQVRFAPELCSRVPRFGGASLEVLWPCPRYDPALGLNDNSITLRLAFGRHSFLLTGDVEHDAEARLVAKGDSLAADVLKVAHHGSRTSTSPSFLAAVQPTVAIISSGAGNRYGHPSPEVVARLRNAGARVLRTDLGGGVIVSTDGETLRIRR